MKEDLLKYKKQLILGPFFKLLEAIFELLIPTLMVNVIDVGAAEGNKKYIIGMGILMLGIAVLGFGCALVCQYYASVASQGFGTALRNKLFHTILGFSHAETDKIGTSALVNRITNDVNVLQQAVAMMIRLVIRAPFICVGSLVMAMYLNFKLSLVILAALPLLAASVYLVIRVTVPIYKKVQQKLDRISIIVRENLSGVRVIRSFSKEKQECTRFEEANHEYYEASVKVGKISALLNPITSAIMNIAIICILWFGKIKINAGMMTDGEMIAFINYITYMVTALLVIANLVVLFTKAAASYARVKEILDTDVSIQNPIESDFGCEMEQDDTTLSFQNVSFSYHGGEPALKNITFSLKKGETLGVIGGTGSGKTTLINLIPRFYDPTEGEIFVFGKEIREQSLDFLRSRISVAAQKAVLFSGTIAENIRQGKKDAGEDEVRAAACAAQAEEFIERLPDGYDTQVERGGANFSGGQKQRLSIARALVRKPNILILDDSTSALDYGTESRLRMAVSERKIDNIIIVAQRVGSIKNADKILVLDDGACVGQGTHEELAESCAVYREILRLS